VVHPAVLLCADPNTRNSSGIQPIPWKSRLGDLLLKRAKLVDLYRASPIRNLEVRENVLPANASGVRVCEEVKGKPARIPNLKWHELPQSAGNISTSKY